MAEYWHKRLQDALHDSLNAPTSAIREIHLRTAEHYRSLADCTAASYRDGVWTRLAV